MDSADLLRRFERHEDGSWTCLDHAEIMTVAGPITIEAGQTFVYGQKVGPLDVAEYLEQLGAQFGS